MRTAVLGAMVLTVVALAAAAVAVGPHEAYGQRGATAPAAGGGLITLTTAAGEHREQLTVIDPETRTLAVYHIDTASGEVVLKSVRNIHYDLRMMEFNGTSPLPGEIRAIVEQR